MENNRKISEAEWEVMKVIWSGSPKTANEVINALSGKTLWKPKTIRTLINRLVRKGVLGFEKKSRVYHYFPLLTEQQCVGAETRCFLSRIRGDSGGTLQPMLAALLEEQKLTSREIEELKRILEEKRTSQAE